MIHLTMTTRRMTGRPPASADRSAARPGGAATDNGQRTTDKKRGFTLVELLVVIVVLGILMALLLPAINGALRTARTAAVSAEINSLAQALTAFKAKYGDYPPSRIYLMENGDYSAATVPISSSPSVSNIDPTSPGGANDITVAQLAARTLQAFRKFWPRVQLSTQAGGVFPQNSTIWYDFNGNGHFDYNTPYVLRGHECLAFFLGGIPLLDNATGTYGFTGFGNDPTNPFSNMQFNSSMYNTNRQQPLYQFNAGRLFPDPANLYIPGTQGTVPIGVPAYYDTFNNGPPSGPPITGSGPVNFYAYFSAYGNGNYDPNDVNIYETDQNATGISLAFWVNFPITGATTTPPLVASPSPNPYTTTLTAGTTSGTVTYQSPQTFQIISSGTDGLYGVGGQYVAQSQTSTQPLPFDANHTDTSDASVRQREFDNVGNFKSGRLD